MQTNVLARIFALKWSTDAELCLPFYEHFGQRVLPRLEFLVLFGRGVEARLCERHLDRVEVPHALPVVVHCRVQVSEAHSRRAAEDLALPACVDGRKNLI